jgi:hypothetical protein
MLSIEDWKTFIATRKDNADVNKNTSVFTEAWLPEKSRDQRFQMLAADPDMVLFAADSNKKLLVLHSFKNAGGTLLRLEKKLMCLSDTGSLATVFEVDHLTLMAECNLVTPTIDELQECKKETKVAEVETPEENGLVTYPGSASFLPAPWLADAVRAANSSNPFLLITTVNAAATVCDLEHEEDENYITTAVDHAGDFILWAWGIGADQVSATRIIFDPTDYDLEHFKIKRHQTCIIPSGGLPWVAVPGGLPPPPAVELSNSAFLSLLNTTISRQADEQEEQNKILTKQLEHMIEKEGSSKNQFNNLHESSIQMILFASALDKDKIPDKPVDSLKRIINSKMVALTEQELNIQFETHGLNVVSFSPGYITNIYSGSLTWASSDTPSNHSPFSFAEVEPIRVAEQKSRHLTLQLILTQGRGMSVEEIKASNVGSPPPNEFPRIARTAPDVHSCHRHSLWRTKRWIPMPQGSLEHDELLQVHLQSKGMPRRRIPSKIPLRS